MSIVLNGSTNNITVDNVDVATDTDLALKADIVEMYESIEINVPTACILTFPVGVVPTGFLECNGTELSRIVYGNLFAVIGTTYGAGDGSTTFNIPDLRGEFIRGFDNSRGIDSGRSIGSLQLDEVNLDNLKKEATGENIASNGAGWLPLIRNSSQVYFQEWEFGSGGNETRPRNVAMMYCIKY